MVHFLKLVTALLLSSTLATAVHADTSNLLDKLKSPPRQYGPYVWWHWSNGHIDEKEAVKDIEWFADIGVAGVQLFEAGLGNPAQNRVIYGSLPWRNAVKASAERADALNVKFAITTSPGWSAAGGPWVPPQHGMKKLAWSEVQIQGGSTVQVELAPQQTTGPFQDIPASLAGLQDSNSYYQDLKVLAVKRRYQPLQPSTILFNGLPAQSAALTDGKLWPASRISKNAQGESYVDISFANRVEITGISLGLPGARGFAAPALPEAKLYYEKSGRYEFLAQLPVSNAMTRTVAFETVKAKKFRLELVTNDATAEQRHYGLGVNKLPFNTKQDHHSISEIRFFNSPLLSLYEQKAGFSVAQNYDDIRASSQSVALKPDSDIIDISDKLSDNTLIWDAPEGDWQIIRFGYNLTGKKNGPAPAEATGLEVDKLNPDMVKQYFENYLNNYRDDNGRLFPGISDILSDSIESGPQNWSPGMEKHFMHRYGYDPTPYLLTFTGRIVNSTQESEKFLWDFRNLIAELLVSNYYETIHKIAQENNLSFYAEALEDVRPQLGNDLDMRAAAQIPMAAYWYYPKGGKPKPTYIMDIKGAASVAALTGNPVVAVESLTAFGEPWSISPADLKPVADQIFLHGGTRLMLHSSVHQAVGKNFTPGNNLSPVLGHHFSRNETWADHSKPWIEYLTRSQFIMQNTASAASYLFFIGEEAPVTGLYGKELPQQLPSGFDYHFVSRQGLKQLKIRNNKVFNQSGNQYDFIYLGGSSERMTIDALKEIKRFASAGVPIIGNKPVESPSLADPDPIFNSLVQQIWSVPNIYDTSHFPQALAKIKAVPQWLLPAQLSDKIGINHRMAKDKNIYFIVNNDNQPAEVPLSVRTNQANMILFDPVSASQQPLTAERSNAQGLSLVKLKLPPYSSFFLIEPNSDTVSSAGSVHQQSCQQKIHNLTARWQVQSDERYPFPFKTTVLDKPELSSAQAENIHYYSGVTRFKTTFSLAAPLSGAYSFELDQIGDIGHLFVNGMPAGYLWHPPLTLDITALLKLNDNSLEVSVANLWQNRLVGNALQQKTIAGWNYQPYNDQAAVRFAGLRNPKIVNSQHCPPQ